MYRKEFPASWQITLTGFAGVASAVGLIAALELWRRQPEFFGLPMQSLVEELQSDIQSDDGLSEDPLLEDTEPSGQRLLPF